MQENIAISENIPFTRVGEGVMRRVLAHSDSLMSVEVAFDAGAEGAVHAHPHTQCSYVLSGQFEYRLGKETIVLRQGDSLVVPPSLPHGTVCLKAGALLDIFTPAREDFLPPSPSR